VLHSQHANELKWSEFNNNNNNSRVLLFFLLPLASQPFVGCSFLDLRYFTVFYYGVKYQPLRPTPNLEDHNFLSLLTPLAEQPQF